jgi:hypothetical protein
MRKLFRWPVLATLVALSAGGVVLARHLWAMPGGVAGRDPFTLVHSLTPLDLCHPEVANQCAVGVDAQGPFLNFTAQPGNTGPIMMFTYRPRGIQANTPAQFGDGGIHAVDMFRALFERWARSSPVAQYMFIGGPPLADHWSKICHYGSPPPVLPMHVEIGSVMMGVGGGYPTLTFAVDPTGSFEDYQFNFDPQ